MTIVLEVKIELYFACPNYAHLTRPFRKCPWQVGNGTKTEQLRHQPHGGNWLLGHVQKGSEQWPIAR